MESGVEALFETRIEPIQMGEVGELKKCNQTVLPVYYMAGQYRQFLRDPNYLLLKAVSEKDEFMGYVVGRLENPKRFHIITFGVYPQFRRGGIGTQLMNAISQQAVKTFPEVKFLTLYVQTCNPAAIGFYERFGFQRIRTMEDYYGPGEDGYTYGKNIRILAQVTPKKSEVHTAPEE